MLIQQKNTEVIKVALTFIAFKALRTDENFLTRFKKSILFCHHHSLFHSVI